VGVAWGVAEGVGIVWGMVEVGKVDDDGVARGWAV
jgi:hypothetical protein